MSNAVTSNPLLVASYTYIALVWGVSQIVYVPFVAHLLSLVTAILYASCHASLGLLLKDVDEANSSSEHSSSTDKASVSSETLKQSDAYQFPLFGSLSLFSLYLAFKFLDKELVNLAIGAYFLFVGCFALTMTVVPLVEKVTPESFRRQHQLTFVTKLPEWITQGASGEYNFAGILAFLGSAGVCSLYFMLGKPWYLNNVLGISFCLQGVERFSLGSYKIGAILLIGLFFYDIFWVFGTEVMVTVAKNLDGPIKLLFPRGSLLPKNGELGSAPELSLLGLGDIVIPGFFLALLLRFDAHRAQVKIRSPSDVYLSFPKPYFVSALIAYILGLATTLFVMFYFNAAQPALLYLVPACLLSSLLCALVRGEVKQLFDYTEEEEEEEDAAKDGAADAKKDN
ncbi:minor histocompatibility antigen H13 [Fistulifera solaris]|uniref:Minor histocompatibility antigen H13 n=1 Tax=Fistulifera solaris TaxID=1519565 RepID=A0A1Z5K7W9_FISSO|nr:minor histocompatibility antigen H13 [Fistulifera solaris]|eukprot:GAX22337.1 minor histocompatibility antigen H13 [Fistulifera solaris]